MLAHSDRQLGVTLVVSILVLVLGLVVVFDEGSLAGLVAIFVGLLFTVVGGREAWRRRRS